MASAGFPSLSAPADGGDPDRMQTEEDTRDHAADEEAQIAALSASVRDQDDLERDIGRQADQLLLEQADERDRKRLEKTSKDKARLENSIRLLDQKLTEFGNHVTKNKYRSEIDHYKAQIAVFDQDLRQIQKRIDDRHGAGQDADVSIAGESDSSRPLPGESRHDFLVRTGKITPFSKMGRAVLRSSSNLGDVLMDAEEEEEDDNDADRADDESALQHQSQGEPKSHRELRAPGFEDDDEALARRLQQQYNDLERPAKRRRVLRHRPSSPAADDMDAATSEADQNYEPDAESDNKGAFAESEESVSEEDVADMATTVGITRKSRSANKKITTHQRSSENEDLAGIDDGDEKVYQSRIQSWVNRRGAMRRRVKAEQAGDDQSTNIAEIDEEHQREGQSDAELEWHSPHPSRADAEFEGGYRIPGDIYPSLFDYQKTGVQWLWELYSQEVGGIVGDEMGLGKTIQIISFLAGLHYSKRLTKPIIVVCPATVMKQWVNEFHRWWPPLRVSILHTSGSGMLDVRSEEKYEAELEDHAGNSWAKHGKGHKAAKRIVEKVARDGHVLVTTYSGLQTYAELLIPHEWEYAVLDEGHKIRNPNTSITIHCKELRTHNRIILSGTPIQNNLTELWSLFDFVYPMRLGTLVNFKNQFEIPIKQGGYANASNLQVETAMRCAETLKDTISPYLLQRFKVDVAADLPKKTERVLFCKLTKLQRDAYEGFLGSEEMKSILDGKRQALYGVDILRKISNHPDLVQHKTLSKKVGYMYGNGAKSGKMQVVKALLEIWKRNGHKTLLFAQHRIMLDILEIFVKGMEGVNYRRMDGNTSIKDRQGLVDEFNNDPDLHVFLLTTKVGGLGVNLTGANRVIIYDPDWNPSTDVQARERAWRLGQKKEVEIYRLMTAGTIEEKIYHRQIFKQFLTNKILKDPKQRQTFHLRDLHDLFTLGDSIDGETETGNMFKGTEVKLSSGIEAASDEQGWHTPPGDGQADKGKGPVSDIAGISRQEEWRGNKDEETAKASDSGEPASSLKDERMLSTIFARTGVQNAYEHDAIINGSKTVRLDPALIAREAKKVAADAARELQRAGELARNVPAGVPTWTGQMGTSGRPPSPPQRGGLSSRGTRGGRGGRGGGPSSASVLANLQSRQAGMHPNGGSSSSPLPQPNNSLNRPQPKGKDFLVLIRDYLVAQGGSAYTQMLIDHFNRFCGTPQRTAEFKEMLKTIAVLEKGGRARGKWALKEDYR